ncbi:MAG: hypothetical protein GY754_09855, partial [bacterium]|nr:hypothetical protein [bacterium]
MGYTSIRIHGRTGALEQIPKAGVYSVERPPLGEPRIIIRGWIGNAQPRAGLESEMACASEHAIQEMNNWDRAHRKGPGLGIESESAIRFAPRFVSRSLQRWGIEEYLREIRVLAPATTRYHLTTTTKTHLRTLRLKEIHYIAGVENQGGIDTLFETTIEVKLNGQTRVGIKMPGADSYTWEGWKDGLS